MLSSKSFIVLALMSLIHLLILFFRERESKGGRNRGKETSHQLVASCKRPSQAGMCPDQEVTGHLLPCGTTPNQLSHTDQGPLIHLELILYVV